MAGVPNSEGGSGIPAAWEAVVTLPPGLLLPPPSRKWIAAWQLFPGFESSFKIERFAKKACFFFIGVGNPPPHTHPVQTHPVPLLTQPYPNTSCAYLLTHWRPPPHPHSYSHIPYTPKPTFTHTQQGTRTHPPGPLTLVCTHLFTRTAVTLTQKHTPTDSHTLKP